MEAGAVMQPSLALLVRSISERRAVAGERSHRKAGAGRLGDRAGDRCHCAMRGRGGTHEFRIVASNATG
jgi:hypothetical protein